jgi:hypothetical protein
MMFNQSRFPLPALYLLSACLLPSTAQAIATTPAAQDVLRIHPGLPRKAHDSLFSYTVEWRIDDGELYRATGISFLNAAKIDAQAAESHVTKKLFIALKDAMIQLDPNWRGITYTQADNQPVLLLANKSGYSLTSVTLRDYSNQPLSYDIKDKSFSSDGIQAAIDIVYAADVEYLDGFTSKKAQYASQGEISITLDDHKPLIVKTDGKTSRQLEEEIAKALPGAAFSDKPIYPSLESSDTRNIKPFDGGEVQLLNLNAKHLRIDVSDPNLGVLTKFKYKDENHTVKVVEPRFMMAALGLISALTVVFLWRKNAKKATSA